MISIIKDVNFYLRDELWSGALNTFDVIVENNKSQELMYLLEELYPEPVEITTINDLLWFDNDFIYKQLDIKVDE